MARKNNLLIGCRCFQCRQGARSKWGKSQLKACTRKIRHDTKHLIKNGNYDEYTDVVVSSGYLD